jgi:putative CocE/NonD family hydrolase
MDNARNLGNDCAMAVTLESIGPAEVDPRAQQYMVPMRDGVSLAIDVYLPDGPGPWPAVLVRLPYDKNGRYCWMPFLSRFFTERGYAFLPQDVRGKFRSQGEVNAFVHEAADGHDTIEWITQQPWADGAVGMWGDSYYGFTQWAAVASGHPALKAIVPRVTMADLFRWFDGVSPLYGAHYMAQYWSDSRTHHFTPDWSHRPLSEVFDGFFEAIGSRSIAFDRVVAAACGQPQPDLYPQGHPFDRLRIPTLHGVGWFDNITPPHMLDYERLVADPATAPFQYLHAGSTDHENYQFEAVPIPESSDHNVHDDALALMLPRYIGPAIDFFDAFLTGRCDPASVPRTRWHLGNEGWQSSPSWPPPGARERRLHLAAAGTLTDEPAGDGEVAWVHDPEQLVPSTIVNAFAFLYEYPDEQEVAARPDVVTFSSDPLIEPLTLAGRVVAHLTVGSDGPSMFVHVKLVDVAPDGGAHILLYGQDAVDRPGEGTPAQVYLGHTGHRLMPGHRLRLQVASSDYPLYLPHPGTSENPWTAVETRINHQRLVTGASSYLSLTVLD